MFKKWIRLFRKSKEKQAEKVEKLGTLTLHCEGHYGIIPVFKSHNKNEVILQYLVDVYHPDEIAGVRIESRVGSGKNWTRDELIRTLEKILRGEEVEDFNEALKKDISKEFEVIMERRSEHEIVESIRSKKISINFNIKVKKP